VGIKLEPKLTSRQMDPQTGIVTDAPVNSNNANPVRGLQISRSKPQPSVPVLWWSSKTIRLAHQRLRQLRAPAVTAEPLRAEDMPDYVLVIEGSEQLRILRDATEDLHDSVFLELASGTTLDLELFRWNGAGRTARRVSFPQGNRRPSNDRSGERAHRLPLQSLSQDASSLPRQYALFSC
jgi:hypothetical protein